MAQAGGSGEGGANGSGGELHSCAEPSAPSVPLRRLSPFEYDNTVREVCGVTTNPAAAAFADLPAASDREPASAADIEVYHALAHDLAIELTSTASRLVSVIGCDPMLIPESQCRAQLIDQLVPRLFRAPLSSEVREQMGKTFAVGAKLGGTFASGARAVLELALQSPEFLYRVELGEPAPDVSPWMFRPSSYEMAARLSYFLRGGPPDAELRAAAEHDQLRTKAQVAEHARRLLTERDARQVVAYFHLNHLGLLDPNWAKLAQLDDELAALMRQEVATFVDDVAFASAGNLRGLLTEPTTWLNGPLAAHYGVEGVTGEQFQRVSLEPAQRAGLLTLGAFLAGRSGASNPSARGAAVRRNLLCLALPGHPPGLVTPPPAPGGTTRERWELATSSSPTCTTCHRYTDPIGFAFEHYDGLGRFRETEAGKTIDVSGEIVESDAQGSFVGPGELGKLLASSVDVHDCYADKWLSFAYGRDQLDEDHCSRETLHAAFRESKGNILELLVAVTQTDGFLYRPISEVAP